MNRNCQHCIYWQQWHERRGKQIAGYCVNCASRKAKVYSDDGCRNFKDKDEPWVPVDGKEGCETEEEK